MKQQNKLYEDILSASAVDAFSGYIREFLSALKLSSRDISRYTVSAEEILLNYLEKNYGEAKIRLSVGKRFFRNFIQLEIEGDADNLYHSDTNEYSVLGDQILQSLGLSPEYSYSGGKNTYFFRIKKKSINPFLSLVISLASAILAGFGGLFIPDGARNIILDSFLVPLHDTFLNALGCIAGPMIFLSVAWGIYGIGDASTLKRIGKRLITGYIGTVSVCAVVVGILFIPLFSLNFSASSDTFSELSSILSMFLGIIPKNIFSPFTEGNTMQIIFLAVIIGTVMLFLGQKTTAVAKAVEQINYIVQFLIEAISKLVPYFIFIIIVKMIWSDSFSVFAKVGKMFGLFILAVIIMLILVITYTAIRNRVNPLLLIKKGIPTFLIAITTASSAAAFGTNIKACRTQYGISDTISSFGLPLGMVTFKPATALSYLVIALSFAEIYKVSISPAWFIMMLLTSIILSLATPPIPGGAITAYTVLLTQLSIPSTALAIVLACDTIFDFINTGCDQFLLPFAIINQSGKLGMLNNDMLKSNTDINLPWRKKK